MTSTGKAHYVSRSGYKRVVGQLREQEGRDAQIREERAIAHEFSGDGWHDNPHFNALQQMEANSSMRLAELRRKLSALVVYEVRDGERPTDRVRLGSIVELIAIDPATGGREERIIEIVGHQESEGRSRVAYDVPFGAALIGAVVDDSIEIRRPKGSVEVEIVALHAARRKPRGGGIRRRPSLGSGAEASAEGRRGGKWL